MKILSKSTSFLFKAFLWVYFVISLYPLLYMLFFSLKNNDEIFYTNPLGVPTTLRFDNYWAALNKFDIGMYFKNSIIVSVASLLIILIFSLMFAFAAARLEWKLRTFSYSYLLLGLFIPTQVILIPLAVMMRDIGIANSYSALIVPYIAFNLSFSSLIFYGFFRTIPVEIEESAYMDGANLYRIFIQIMLPLVRPAVATVTIFAFLAVWNEFPLALILITDPLHKTLPVGLLSFTGQYGTEWGPMGAAMVISSIPMIVCYLFLGDQVEKALTVGSAVKG